MLDISHMMTSAETMLAKNHKWVCISNRSIRITPAEKHSEHFTIANIGQDTFFLPPELASRQILNPPQGDIIILTN